MEEKELMEKIKMIICAEESVNPDMVFIRTRIGAIKLTRQIIAYYCRKYITGSDGKPLSFEKIGEFVKLDHATVLHSCRAIEGWISTNREFREKMDDYDQKIKDGSGVYTLNVALLLQDKVRKQMTAIKKDVNLLDEIIKKIMPEAVV